MTLVLLPLGINKHNDSMVGFTHPLIEIEDQDKRGPGIFSYTLLVTELNERRAKRKVKFYLTRLWGLNKEDVTLNSIERTDKEPFGEREGIIELEGPLTVYRVDAVVNKDMST